jgi:hypothetical protein
MADALQTASKVDVFYSDEQDSLSQTRRSRGGWSFAPLRDIGPSPAELP